MSTILLLGMESDLANQLTRAFFGRKGIRCKLPIRWILRCGGAVLDVIFAGGHGPDYRETVRRLTTLKHVGFQLCWSTGCPRTPAGSTRLELGAADYCGAPFEAAQLRWLMDSVLRRSAAVAA